VVIVSMSCRPTIQCKGFADLFADDARIIFDGARSAPALKDLNLLRKSPEYFFRRRGRAERQV